MILKLDREVIEICDNKKEIINFSIKEIMNLLNEIQEDDYPELDIFVDIITILKNIANINFIEPEEIENRYLEKLETEGNFSRYLLKIL